MSYLIIRPRTDMPVTAGGANLILLLQKVVK